MPVFMLYSVALQDKIIKFLRTLLSFLLLLAISAVHAQVVTGVVTDGATGKPLFPVNIVNTTNGTNTTTDEKGNFTITANADDGIYFSFVGYNTIKKNSPSPGNTFYVQLYPLSQELKEFILRPGLTSFQKDSIDMITEYGNGMNTDRIKPTFGTADGSAGVSGLIGSLVQKHSRVYKSNKRFKEDFINDEKQKFIDTRYTPKLVTALTGLEGDTLVFFMNNYPMDYDFARSATELEIKMWIRNSYKDYLHDMEGKKNEHNHEK